MKRRTESFWPSISDLMSGLMMVFLFIAIAFMLMIEKQKEVIITEKNISNSMIGSFASVEGKAEDLSLGDYSTQA